MFYKNTDKYMEILNYTQNELKWVRDQNVKAILAHLEGKKCDLFHHKDTLYRDTSSNSSQ